MLEPLTVPEPSRIVLRLIVRVLRDASRDRQLGVERFKNQRGERGVNLEERFIMSSRQPPRRQECQERRWKIEDRRLRITLSDDSIFALGDPGVLAVIYSWISQPNAHCTLRIGAQEERLEKDLPAGQRAMCNAHWAMAVIQLSRGRSRRARKFLGGTSLRP